MSNSSQKTQQSTSNPYAIQTFQNAQASLPQSYSPVTGAQIQSYMNPYTSSVINATNAVSNQQEQQALNADSDAATKAGAFGGDRASVAQGITQGQFNLNNQLTDATLNNQNYSQAMGVAQQQNAAQNQYPLALKALLGQLAGGTQQNSSGSASSSGYNLNPFLNAFANAAVIG